MSGLGELIARVEGATGADRNLDVDVFEAVGEGDRLKMWNRRGLSHLTASVDAVLALAAEKLPGDLGSIGVLNSALVDLRADIFRGSIHGPQVTSGHIARYTLAAVLRTLDAQEATEGGRVGEHG